jgi:predicted nucleic acid-binding protein
MIILDTNVLSEALRPKPADMVRRWMETQPSAALFTTSVCEAEILYGLALLPPGKRRAALEHAVAAIFEDTLSGRVLPFDSAAARAFAAIAAKRRRLGRPISESDAQIAAIASIHAAAIATRNVRDFSDCGVNVVSPWEK